MRRKRRKSHGSTRRRSPLRPLNWAKTSEADAVFLSCTNLRTLDIIEEIETPLGKPALSSNQVLAWDMARRAGLTLNHPGLGRLLAG